MVKPTRTGKITLHSLNPSPNTPESITARGLALDARPRPRAQHGASSFHAKATGSQRTLLTGADHPTGHLVLLKFLNSPVKKNPKKNNTKKTRGGNLYFWKTATRNNKSAQVLQKNSLSYLECDRSGFPIKTWETLTSVTPRTLDSAQSSVLGREKQKWWVDEENTSVLQ